MVAVADGGIVPEQEERFSNLDKRIPGASWAEISMASSRAGASEEGRHDYGEATLSSSST